MERSRALSLFEAAPEVGAFDEFPVLPPGVDPQLHLSRNDGRQPFHRVCDHDTLLLQLAGRARVDLRYSPVRWEDLEPGDLLYVPAGVPTRIETVEPSLHVRYKAAQPAVEGCAWFCDRCGTEYRRDEFDVREVRPQQAYAQSCAAFNASAEARRCDCGHVHDPVEIDGTRWDEVVAQLDASG